MAHGLYVVAVEVAQEHAVVAGVVLGKLTRGVQHLRAGDPSGLVDRVNGAPVGGVEGQVQFPGLGAVGWTEPEVWEAVGPGQTDDEGVALRKAHHLAHPDRDEGA